MTLTVFSSLTVVIHAVSLVKSLVLAEVTQRLGLIQLI